MPAEQVGHQSGDGEVEKIVGGGKRAGGERGEDDDLQGVGENRDQHGSAKLRAGRNGDGVVSQREILCLILDDAGKRCRGATKMKKTSRTGESLLQNSRYRRGEGGFDSVLKRGGSRVKDQQNSGGC